MIEKLGFVSAVILPLWNIPLMLRVIHRRSSQDISLWWALGVWVCILMMFPAGIQSPDPIWRTFTWTNTVLFTAVVLVTLKYRKKTPKDSEKHADR